MKEGFFPEEGKGSRRMISWKKGVSGVDVVRIICPIQLCILILRISIIRYLLKGQLWSLRLKRCK